MAKYDWDLSKESCKELVVSDIKESTEVLQKRLKKNGYIFFRDVLPTQILSDARDEAIELGRRYKYLAKDLMLGHPTIHPDLTAKRLDKEGTHQFVMEWAWLKRFSKVVTEKKLHQVFRKVLGGAVTVHPLRDARWGRIAFPDQLASGITPHQDYDYLGEPAETYTAWIPLSDIPAYFGGLATAQGSYRIGPLPHHKVHGVQKPKGKLQWHSTNYNLGDCLIFHSHQIHGPLPNTTQSMVRFSMDLRFCRKDVFDKDLLKHPEFGRITEVK